MSVTPINAASRAAAVEALKPRAESPAAATRAAAPAAVPDALTLSGTAVAAAALAVAPPVDTARVDALQAAIADGSYRADPAAIADRMIALDLG